MPGKKFKAPNSKAEAARERKETAKREVEERKKKEEEDKFWQDDDKHASRKQERKVRIFILYTSRVSLHVHVQGTLGISNGYTVQWFSITVYGHSISQPLPPKLQYSGKNLAHKWPLI